MKKKVTNFTKNRRNIYKIHINIIMVSYMHFSPKAQAVSVALTALLSSFSVAHTSDAFAAESPWMFGDWDGQRTTLQKQGYDFSFGYTGEMATLLDAKRASSHGTEYAD